MEEKGKIVRKFDVTLSTVRNDICPFLEPD